MKRNTHYREKNKFKLQIHFTILLVLSGLVMGISTMFFERQVILDYFAKEKLTKQNLVIKIISSELNNISIPSTLVPSSKKTLSNIIEPYLSDVEGAILIFDKSNNYILFNKNINLKNNSNLVKIITDKLPNLIQQQKEFNLTTHKQNFFLITDKSLGESPVYFNVTILPNKSWQIVTISPLKNIINIIEDIITKITLLTITIRIIIFIVFYLYIKKIFLNPIKKMINTLSKNNFANKFSTFHSLDETINNEFGQIAYWYNLRTKELLEAKLKADKAGQAMSDFLANMSHEIRTPLNSIIGTLELVLDMQHSAKVSKMLEVINLSSKYLLEIINDILELSKIEANGIQLEKIPFNLIKLLDKNLKPLSSLAENKNLTFKTELNIPKSEMNLIGDPVRFSTIITNLVSNAIKYTEKGEINLILNIKDEIKNSAVISIDVIDTGIGIAADKINYVFEKFAQADSTITRKYGGSGLGLCITKQLVELMHGKISLKSQFGMGSMFKVEIPFSINYELDIVDNILPNENFFNGIIPPEEVKILIAEDHPLNQLLMKNILSSFGIKHFIMVENGIQTVEEFEKGEYDIILMDCQMPYMSGYEATTQIRSLENKSSLKHIAIVALTANAMSGEKEKCLKLGMDNYISKPIYKNQLKLILSQWIKFDNFNKNSQSNIINQNIIDQVENTEGENSLAILDLTFIDAYTEGDDEIRKEFIQIFLTQSASQLKSLENFCKDGQITEWKELSHSLTGGAASIGALKMRKVCNHSQQISDASAASKAQTLQKIKACFEEVKAKFKELNLIELN